MASPDFTIDPASSVPPFRQLHDSVVAAVKSGALVPGAKLPTVRALAAELGLATNTVASAYRSLEAAGVVEGRGRAGTFVQFGDDPIESGARQIALDAARGLRDLGVDRARALKLLGEAFDA
ncbi:GntR family transcriptional regulator [Leucobacter denitrificans]|uniref:GntR family transcriptional regulator n=1 Tax=Leucobacter denitrificans TaxID=683042 RepID=A0A7G9S6D6_9MICO|nr:GntR family transcriptional regulator [Leucobacter denitrificans]QNN63411.1 GntR family transcriptional regulator [Leucobacter denitrificans]